MIDTPEQYYLPIRENEVLHSAIQQNAFEVRGQQRIEARRNGNSRHVVIAVSPGIIGQVQAPVVKKMRKSYPDLRIKIIDEPSAKIREAVLLVVTDIGIDSSINSNFDGLVARKLISDELCVVLLALHLQMANLLSSEFRLIAKLLN